MAANQANDIPLALEHLTKQTECLKKLHGEDSTQYPSNLFLLAALKLKTAQFEEALKFNKQACDLLEVTKEKFGEDYGIIAAKFFTQAANVNFANGNKAGALDFAERGLAEIDSIKTMEKDVERAMIKTRRDLLNIIVRTKPAVQKDCTKSARELREEYAAKYELSSIFMPDQGQRLEDLA